MAESKPILQVQDVYKYFPVRRRLFEAIALKPQKSVRAVDGVSFGVRRGEILALVGESGSGKTTIGMNILGLQRPTRGKILYDRYDISEWAQGHDPSSSSADSELTDLDPRARIRSLRRKAQMIFQDPYEALNPRQKVFDITSEPLIIHRLTKSKQEMEERVREALETCGLAPADHFWDRYPGELSGGQRQRVVVAGALVLEPELLVADEPVSMLDVSIRAEILNLLLTLREQRSITILYTTHDLATAGFFTDRMAVMYLGRIVEIGPTSKVLSEPRHPYTRALISVIPVPNPRRRRARVILQGEIPNPIDVPSGCRFHPRCPDAVPDCQKVDPALHPINHEHEVACILV